jgi:hypothetical protein
LEFAGYGSITQAYLLKDSGDAEKLSIAIDNAGIGVRQYDRKVIFGTFEQVGSFLSVGFQGAGQERSTSELVSEAIGASLAVVSEFRISPINYARGSH